MCLMGEHLLVFEESSSDASAIGQDSSQEDVVRVLSCEWATQTAQHDALGRWI
jgi:hypothetical protein